MLPAAKEELGAQRSQVSSCFRLVMRLSIRDHTFGSFLSVAMVLTGV